MYQAVFYDHAERLYHLKDDQKGWHSFEYWPTYYVAHPDGELETLDGTRVAPVKKMQDWKDPKYYEKDVDKITRLLVDLYYKTDDVPSYHNVVYLDIECEIAGALTPENIKAAPTKVTSISLYDNNTKKYICFILDKEKKLKSSIVEENKEICSYTHEEDLLMAFLNEWETLDPTIISGWNCIPINESVWLKDRITSIKKIDVNSSLNKYGKVVRKSSVSKKEEYEILLHNGKIIKCSKDHVFPFWYKKSYEYKNPNTLLKNNNEDSLENMMNLKDMDLYLRLEKNINNNDDLNYEKLCNELNIECPSYLENKTIENEDLQLLGMLFTDGSISKNESRCYICNSDFDLIKKYIPIVNKYRQSILTENNVVQHVNCLSPKPNFICNFTKTEKLNILLNFIWNNKKQLNKELISLLSHSQFKSLFSGMMDGDGCVSKKTVGYCNFEEGNIDVIYELLLWNGITSYIQNKNNINIPLNNRLNFDFLNSLSLYSHKRKNKINNIIYKKKKNTISNNIRGFQYDNFDLIKIKSIKSTGQHVDMMDIETSTHYFITNGIKTHNCAYFDIPYLYSRIKNLLGEDQAVRLSPIRKIKFQEYDTEQPIVIGGINHLDYMLLFKKYVAKQESSYKLGDIGKKYVNLGKIEYQGSLDKLFQEDIDKFIEYNIRDVEIIVALEDKLKFIDLTITICHLCHVGYEQIYYSTMLNEGAILTYLKRKNIISPNKPTTYNPALKEVHEEYAGGFLLEPKPGLYKWLIDDDYSSLYPSIIRSLNLGIETYVGRIVDRVDKEDCWWGLEDLKSKDPDMLLLLENKKNKTTKIKVSKLIEIIETENLTISASGALFQTNKKSVVCEILEDWFNKRKIYKKKMKEAYLGGDKEKGNFYNSRQHSFKILLNSVYGCYAINGWRYTDGRKILSSAITLTGQRMIKETIKEANRLMEELLEK